MDNERRRRDAQSSPAARGERRVWCIVASGMAAPTLAVERFAQLRKVEISFGDLTILVGPQATGKSIVLQLLKLAVDSSRSSRRRDG